MSGPRRSPPRWPTAWSTTSRRRSTWRWSTTSGWPRTWAAWCRWSWPATPRARRGVIEPPEPEEGSDETGTDDERRRDDTSGHDVDRPTTGRRDAEETLLLVEGSTGGAGLRGLQGEEPEPLTASILYFDPDTQRLVAYDRITVAWLEDAGATIERHIVGQAEPLTEPSTAVAAHR